MPGGSGGSDRWKQVVSLIQLISDPEKFEGRNVVITGFLQLEREKYVLYLTAEDYTHEIPQNGVCVQRNRSLTQDSEKLNLKYVLLEGTFKATRLRTDQPRCSGEITHVKRIFVWGDLNHSYRDKVRDLNDLFKKGAP